jgi:hypothetical protein
MATTFIPINTGQRLGGDLRRTVDLAREVLDRLEDIKRVMDTQVDGADYSQLESQFGLQTGHGDDVYNLVAGAYAQINVPNVLSLLDRCG